MATYPNEAWPADVTIEGLDGTTDEQTGLPFIAKGTGPTSVPSYEVQYNRWLGRLNGIVAGWRQGMVVDEGSLRIGVYPIEYTLGGLRQYFEGATGVSVPDDTVVYLDGASVLQVADDWPADLTGYLPLATVSTSGGVLSIQDRRPRCAFHVPSVEVNSALEHQVVNAHLTSAAQNQSGVEVFEFDPPSAMTLEGVQVYCTSVTATASVDVRKSGTSVLSAPATPVAGSVVKPTISSPAVGAGEPLTVQVTTNATGQIANLTVTLVLKAALAA
jgi:hypothetical protein